MYNKLFYTYIMYDEINVLTYIKLCCMSSGRRIPVLYVFGCEEIDVDHCVKAFEEFFPTGEERVLVLYDTVYAHCQGETVLVKCTVYIPL